MFKKIAFVALLACVLASPSIPKRPRKLLLSRTSEKVASDSSVDARAQSSGNVNIQQDNLAKTADLVNVRQIKGPLNINLVQNTQADANQKTQTRGKSRVKASQNSQSTAMRQLENINGQTLKVTKSANSKATERVIADGKTKASQAVNANTLQTKKVNDLAGKSDAAQKSRANLKEMIATRGGTVKAAQDASSRVQESGSSLRGGRMVRVNQLSESQTNEQITAKGPSAASQRASAKASDILKGTQIKTGDNINLAESSEAKSAEQLRVKSGQIAQSQRSKSGEKALLNINNKKGVNILVVDKSSSNANGKVIASGQTQSAQQESALAKESARLKVAGEIIKVQDQSESAANDKILTKNGKAQTSQTSQSKSNENLEARIIL